MKNLNIILGIVVIIVIGFLLAKGGYKQSEEEAQNDNGAQVTTLEIKANDWASGNPEAKATLVEYLDFECEACGAYYPLVTQLKKEYQDSLRLVIRYFPLPGHKNSRTAAYAVEAAGKQGKFWEMYNILFTKQQEWSEQQVANQNQFEKYALEAGINIEQWRNDVKSEEVMKRVDDSYNEAVSLNLQGTPSFFLNGKRIDNPQGYEDFKRLIDEAISDSKDSSSANVGQSQTKSYTLGEVAQHNTETNCWMAIEGKVYDVTKFIPTHPGGRAIIGGCGKDATVLFNERPTNDRGPHPAQAKALLPQYEIGILVQ